MRDGSPFARRRRNDTSTRRPRSWWARLRELLAGFGRIFLEDPVDVVALHHESSTLSLLDDLRNPGLDPTAEMAIGTRRIYGAVAALSLSPWLLVLIADSIADSLDPLAGGRLADRVMGSAVPALVLLATFALNLAWAFFVYRTRLFHDVTVAESTWLRVLPYPSVVLPAASAVMLVVVIFGAAMNLVQIVVALIVALLALLFPILALVFFAWLFLGRR